MAIKKSEIELLSNRYSKAIFSSAKSGSKLEKVNQDLQNIAEVIESDESFRKILASGAIVTEQMKQIFAAICDKAGVDEITKNFLTQVAENKRGAIIPQISRKLNNLILNENNMLTAEVISAKKLDEKSLNEVQATLSKKLGKNVTANNVVDPKIIGGLKIKIGSTLFDDSISSKLEKLKQSLATN